MNTKRRRMMPGTEIDRNTLDVVDVALQTAHALVNMDSIEETRNLFETQVRGWTLPPEDAVKGYQPRFKQPAYRMLNDRHQDLHIETIINGKDAELAAQYPGDPDFVRWALRRLMQPIGITGQNSEALDSKDDPDVGIIKAGLQTVEAVGATPGARAVFEIPPLGARDPRVGSVADGTGCNIQTLYTRPYSSALVGETFHRAISHMIYDPAQWAQAMRGYQPGGNVWLNAGLNALNSYLFAGVLFVQQLIKAGKLRPIPGNELDARTAAGAIDGTGTAALLSQYLGLTVDRGDIGRLNAAQFGEYKKLKVDFARRVFYVPTPTGQVNLVDEFGLEFDERARKYVSPARGANLVDLINGSPITDLVNVQVNHFKLLTAGFVEAVNEEERWVAGVYTTGSNEQGSRKAQISLGCAS